MGMVVRFRVPGSVLLASLLLTWGMAFPQGLTAPKHPAISLPKKGLAWLPGEDFQGACEDVPAKGWTRKPSGPFDLLVHAAGPTGSGRYWILTAGIAGRQRETPERGICLQTSTLA